MTQAVHAELLEGARIAHAGAHPDVMDAAAKLLADMEALGTHMSLGGN